MKKKHLSRRWQPMRRADAVPLTEEQIAEHIRLTKKHTGEDYTREDVLRLAASSEIWLNNRYQCAAEWLGDGPLGWVHLSIKSVSKTPVHDWRDLQRIKNDVMGEDREAVELYPAESRVVDTSNQYHLWVLPAGEAMPVGWNVGRIVTEETGKSGARQRRFSK